MNVGGDNIEESTSLIDFSDYGLVQLDSSIKNRQMTNQERLYRYI